LRLSYRTGQCNDNECTILSSATIESCIPSWVVIYSMESTQSTGNYITNTPLNMPYCISSMSLLIHYLFFIRHSIQHSVCNFYIQLKYLAKAQVTTKPTTTRNHSNSHTEKGTILRNPPNATIIHTTPRRHFHISQNRTMRTIGVGVFKLRRGTQTSMSNRVP